ISYFTVLASGWLIKKGEIVKSWKNRFFVADSNYSLNYYEKDDNTKFKGSIKLDNVIQLEYSAPESIPKKVVGIDLVTLTRKYQITDHEYLRIQIHFL